MNKPHDPSRWMPADITMPLPPSKTRLVVRDLEREASAARARGDLVLEGKLRDRILELQRDQQRSRRR